MSSRSYDRRARRHLPRIQPFSQHQSRDMGPQRPLPAYVDPEPEPRLEPELGDEPGPPAVESAIIQQERAEVKAIQQDLAEPGDEAGTPAVESAIDEGQARARAMQQDRAARMMRRRRRNYNVILLIFAVCVCGAVGGALLGTFGGRLRGSVAASSGGSSAAISGTAETGSGGKLSSRRPSATPTANPEAAMSGTAVAAYTYAYPTPVSFPLWSAIQVFCVSKPGAELHALSQNTITANQNHTLDYAWNALGSLTAKPIVSVDFIELGVNTFGRGMDGSLYHKWENTFRVWGPSAKGDENLGGYIYGPPASAWRTANELNVFVIGGVNQLYVKSWVGGAGWQNYAPLGGSWTSFAPTPVSWGEGRMDVFVVSLVDDKLYHRWWTPGSTAINPATAYENLGGSLAGRPVAVSGAANRMDIFARGKDAGLWHLQYSSNRWNGWSRVDGPAIVAEPDAVTTAADEFHVFVWTEDETYQRRSFQGGKWSPVEDLNGTFSGPPKAVVGPDGMVHVYGYSDSGDLMHRSWDREAGVWSPSNSFDNFGPPGNTSLLV